jgi:hypothetical protein
VSADRAIRKTYKFKVKAIIENVRNSEPCYYCGEDAPEVKDFHHMKGEVKLFDVANAWRSYGISKVSAEIAKCRIVCANCHRKIHAGTIGEDDEPYTKTKPIRSNRRIVCSHPTIGEGTVHRAGGAK